MAQYADYSPFNYTRVSSPCRSSNRSTVVGLDGTHLCFATVGDFICAQPD
jgi:hypothetical protein